MDAEQATTSIVPARGPARYLMPAMDVQLAVQRRQQLVEFVKQIMVEDSDFGVIPGTGKRTLLKPGAEKLTTFFGLSKRFTLLEKVEDWDGSAHHGEPFFYYLYRCQLHRDEVLVAEADGSCNSWESKYRYRKAERVCPLCGQATIIKGKAEYGGGWICFAKRGGCGAKFPDGDPAIEQQEVGRVPNRDIADQVNTILKMAEKRALVAATLLAVNASEFFTQDLDDHEDDGPPRSTNGAGVSLSTNGLTNGVANGARIAVESNGQNGHPPPERTAFKNVGDFLTACYQQYGWTQGRVLRELGVGRVQDLPNLSLAWSTIAQLNR